MNRREYSRLYALACPELEILAILISFGEHEKGLFLISELSVPLDRVQFRPPSRLALGSWFLVLGTMGSDNRCLLAS